MARPFNATSFLGSKNNKTTKQGFGTNSRPRKRGKKAYRGQGKR